MIRQRVVEPIEILWIVAEPDSGEPHEGPLRGRRSFRVGTVPIIYRYELRELLVLAVTGGRRIGV